MRMLTVCVAVIFLFIAGCSRGAPEEEDRTGGEITTSPTNLVVSDLNVTLDITPHEECGRMLVTEEFTVTVTKEPGAFVINDSAETTYQMFEKRFHEIMMEYGGWYEGELPKNLVSRMVPFAVYKNGEEQPALTNGQVCDEGGGVTVSADTKVKIELESNESARIKITRAGNISSRWYGNKDEYSYVYDTAYDFGGVYVDTATVTANFARPYDGVNTPPGWRIIRSNRGSVTWEVDSHIPDVFDHHSRDYNTYSKQGEIPYLRVIFHTINDDIWLAVQAKNVNFRRNNDVEGSKVENKPLLFKGEKVKLLYMDGDWYSVITKDGYSGWVRWRYKDPDTGQVNIYVEEFKTPY